jgi:geranylgeranyl pyrophosphate synthase
MGASTSSKNEPPRLDAWAADRLAIDRAILAAVDCPPNHLGRLAPVVRDAVGGGGKRIRGLLLVAAYRAAGGSADVTPVAAAVELVHAYSLVHDDLPCMDDDTLRRGKPTAHVVHGIWPATVAGVAMVPLSAGAMYRACISVGVPDATTRAIVARLMRASGAGGMVGGQLLDLLGERKSLTLMELEAVHRGKTGALIAASAAIGGMVGCATPAQVDALDRFGHVLGLAFQIMDDVLDVTATSETLGKTAGKDTAVQKSTYPALLGLEQASSLAREKVAESLENLRRESLLTDELRTFAHFVVDRSS